MLGGRVFQQTIGIPMGTTVLFAPTCFVIGRRITSYRGFSRKTERIYPDPLISRSAI